MTIIHEIINDEQGFKHRLQDTETNKIGKWANYKYLAELDQYRAGILEYWGEDIPSEIFIVTVYLGETRIISRKQ